MRDRLLSDRRDEEEGVPPPATREPEKLVIPARAVGFLISLGLRTEPGAAWLDGFIAAHGDPGWVVPDGWKIEGRCPAEIVKTEAVAARRPLPGANGKPTT